MMSEDPPEFFQIFCSDSCGQQLEIPSGFIRSIHNGLLNNVILEDGYDKNWRVKITKVRNKFHLVDGWPKFVQDNSIRGGDVIIFKYVSKEKFKITIYRIGHSSTSEGSSSTSEGSSGCKAKGVGGLRESDDEETSPNIEYVHKTRSSTSKKPRRVRRVQSDLYVKDIFRSRLECQLTNPYFVMKVNPKRKAEFYVPKYVISDFKLQPPKEVMLVDPEGRRWKAKLSAWKSERTYYTKGWRMLCKLNMVKVDDLCICEFLKIDGDHCIKVSFVRAGRMLS